MVRCVFGWKGGGAYCDCLLWCVNGLSLPLNWRISHSATGSSSVIFKLCEQVKYMLIEFVMNMS